MTINDVSPLLAAQYKTLTETEECSSREIAIKELGVTLTSKMTRERVQSWESGYFTHDCTNITVNPPNPAVEKVVREHFQQNCERFEIHVPDSHKVLLNSKELCARIDEVSSLFRQHARELHNLADTELPRTLSKVYLVNYQRPVAIKVEMKTVAMATWESSIVQKDTVNVTITPCDEMVVKTVKEHFQKAPSDPTGTWSFYMDVSINGEKQHLPVF